MRGKIKYIILLTQSIARKGSNQWHKFHILKPSVWPLFVSISLLVLALTFIQWMTSDVEHNSFIFVILAFAVVCINLYLWWGDVINESGEHTSKIVKGIRLGMILFIISEILFFFSFFWAFFHSSLNPSIETGLSWPPIGLEEAIIDPKGLPLLNTLLLLSSGVTVTHLHKCTSYIISFHIFMNTTLHKIPDIYVSEHDPNFKLFCINMMHTKKQCIRYRSQAFKSAIATISLGVVFTLIQFYEYYEADFSISDSIFGSCFFMLTGFHGFHVLVGTIFLIISFIQFYKQETFHKAETGLDCAIWYWHFVDVVWLFLYIFIYCWSWEGSEVIKNVNDSDIIPIPEIIFDFNSFCEIGLAQKNQLSFQKAVTVSMENIILLHHNIMYWLIFIFSIVLSLFYYLLLKSDK